jgi:DNA polymerase-3 subunit gamma/tau
VLVAAQFEVDKVQGGRGGSVRQLLLSHFDFLLVMTYLVTARKWRPMVFEDVVGQSHVTATLRNAIASNRLAHAYLFSGPRGIGKTTMARLLAKAINCRNPKDLNPCNQCDICEEITNSRSIDIFEIDGASNRGIDEIRTLRETVRYAPTKCQYKVYIIDEVHMLTKEAFNALLKTLEEPPTHVLFIFATTEVQKLPPTILSRCHRFDFRRIAINEIIDRLKYIAQQEKITIDDDSLLLIAKKGDGSLRDAQSIFDQVVSFCGENITAKQLVDALNLVDQDLFFAVTDFIKTKDSKGGLELVDDIVKRGYDIREFLSGLAEHFRNILVVRSVGSTSLVEASDVHRKRYETVAKQFSENDLLRLMRTVAETETAVKWSTQPRIRLEAGLLQMIKLDSTVEIQELLLQLEELKKKIDGSSLHESNPGQRQKNNSNEGLFSSQASSNHPRATHQDQSSKQVLRGTRAVEAPVSVPLAQMPSVKEPVPPYTVKTAETTTSSERKSIRTISLDEIEGRWKEFVEEIRKQRIHVGTLLSQSRPLAVDDGVVKLGCRDEFHLTTLKRSREFLVQSAQRIYGKKVRFELSLTPLAEDGEEKKGEPSGNEQSKLSTLDHPVIKALMRELGAEPLQ